MWGQSGPMGLKFSIKMPTCTSSNTACFDVWELTSLMGRASFLLMWELGIDVWVKIMFLLPWDWSWVQSGGTAGSFMASKEIPQLLFTILRKTQLNLTRDSYNLLSCSFDIITVLYFFTNFLHLLPSRVACLYISVFYSYTVYGTRAHPFFLE